MGDEILRGVATTIAAEFRPYDGIARYGGDEFVLILPDTDEAGALAAADRLARGAGLPPLVRAPDRDRHRPGRHRAAWASPGTGRAPVAALAAAIDARDNYTLSHSEEVVGLACDAYNATITERPYRKPMSHDEALAELRRGAGSQFDPRVAEALVQLLPERRPEASPAAERPPAGSVLGL